MIAPLAGTLPLKRLLRVRVRVRVRVMIRV
jgi:hypothetical protein